MRKNKDVADSQYDTGDVAVKLETAPNETGNESSDVQPQNSQFKELDNNFAITLSRTLTKQLHNLSKYEGVRPSDLIVEFVSEGIARRIAEDQRPAPSHLMTRNGYVHGPENSQPTLSHHSFQNNGNSRDNPNNGRGKNNFQRQTASSRPPHNGSHNKRKFY